MINVYTLPGGLRVVMEAMPAMRSVSFGLWIRNGSRHEQPKLNGISHFIEHMFFKGTQKRTAFEIADTMDAVGGQLNAYTSKEHTCYYTATLNTHFDTALDVMADMFFNSKFDEAEIDKERNVILEEINMSEDTPDSLVVDLLNQQIYPDNPLGRSILGTPETIMSFKRDDFVNFIRKNYLPGNTVISVAGNIDEQAVLEKISAAFAAFQSGDDPPKQTPAVYTPGFNLREKDIEQVHLCMAFPGLPYGLTEDSYALSAINTILGGGMSSRLFQKLREERGLVYSVYAYNQNFSETGINVIYAALSPAHLNDALHLITDEVRRMLTERVTEAQLAKTKEKFKCNFLMGQENVGGRMMSNGNILLMLNRVFTLDELAAKIDAISLDNFYAVYERLFNFDNVSLSLVGRGVDKLDAAKLIQA